MRFLEAMGSATYVQLLMGLKAFLYSDVLEEALDGCRGGIDATGGSAVLVLERALQVVADRASSPDGGGRHTGGLPLDIIDDEVDATIGVGKPSVGPEDENGVDSSDIASPKRRKKRARDRKLSPTTRTTSPPGPAVPPAVLQQFMALAPNLRRQRLSEFRGAVAAYREEIMNVLEHAATWGPNFGATVPKSFRLPSTFSGDGSLDATFDGFGAGSFGSFSVTAKGAVTQQQQSATSDNFGGVVQRVMRGFQLDPSLILDEFRQHCAGSSNGNNENNMTDVFECSGVGLSRAANASLMTSSTTSPTLSPNHASPVSPRQLQLQAHAVPTSAPAERSNSHVPFSTLSEQPTVDFSNWLLGRQERMIQELERVVGVGSSTDDVPGEEPQYLGIAGAALVSLFGTPGGPTSVGSGGHRAVSPENAGLLAAQSVNPKGGHPTALLSHRRTLTTAPGGGGDSGGGIVGGLSPILDTQSLEHTMSGVLDFQSFEGRTPRRGDERVSGLAPLDQIIERQKHRISQFRDVMPLELQFPYVANIVHKDHKRVTSSEEMLHDLCLSLPNTNVYRVAAALRERRDARLHPLDQGGDQDDGSDGSSSHHKAARKGRGQHRNAFSAAPGSHKMDDLGVSTSQRSDAPTSAMSRSVVGGGSTHRRRSTPSSRCASSQQHRQRVSVVLVTEDDDFSMKKLILVPAGGEETSAENDDGIPAARTEDFLSALPPVHDRLPDASEDSLPPPPSVHTTSTPLPLQGSTSLVSRSPSNSFAEKDSSQLSETNSSINAATTHLFANDASGSSSVIALAAVASSTSMISEVSTVHQTEDEQLMCFWLQGGVPHPAPLSPAKLVQQRRKAAAAAAATVAPPERTPFPSNGARKH
ncbi:Hypothetical protein, putative [Bodo saltans]|uniref:Uncharacterized protein n=1 Tax=Bodo saltans TaxID=75058 RepID=A0A0S4KLC9_BODSA|nr:Hypothetical protein, putative [Bodo saltans]|eukprot:CUI15391.1 Hypothetical protein, putative [Bodo saltans]